MFYYFVVNAVLGLQPAMGYAKEQFGVRVEVGTWISAEHPYQHFEEPPLFCFADHFHFYVAEILPSPNLCLHWYVSLLGLATGGSRVLKWARFVLFCLFVCLFVLVCQFGHSGDCTVQPLYVTVLCHEKWWPLSLQ